MNTLFTPGKLYRINLPKYIIEKINKISSSIPLATTEENFEIIARIPVNDIVIFLGEEIVNWNHMSFNKPLHKVIWKDKIGFVSLIYILEEAK